MRQVVIWLLCVLCISAAGSPLCLATPPRDDVPGVPGDKEKEHGKGRGHHRDRMRGDDPFFSAMREVHSRFGGNRDLIMLLTNRGVREEVEMDEEGYVKLKEYSNRVMDKMMGVRKEMAGKSKEEIREQVMNLAAGHNKELRELLSDSVGQTDRLLGIYIQRVGPRAVVNDLVAEKIKIGSEDLVNLRRAKDELWRESMKDRFKQISKLIREGDRARIQEHIAASEKEFDQQMSKLLTADQLKQLELLKGKSFDVSSLVLFDMQPRRGSGRGPPPPKRGGDSGRRPPKPRA